MSSLKTQNEIQKIIDSVPENALPNVDEFIKELHSKYSELLSKLAK